MADATDKRAAKRKAAHVPVVLQIEGVVLRLRTIDITDAGMGLASENPIPLGRQAKAAVDLYFNGHHHPLDLGGRTVYCNYCSTHGFKVGVHFDEMSPESKQVLLKFLDY